MKQPTKHFLIFVLYCISFAICLTPGRVIADDVPVVLAIVNGDSITTADIDREFMSSHMSMTDAEKANFDYRKLLEKLVNDRLIVQEAEMLQMDQEKDFVEKLNEECSSYRRKVFLADNFKPDIQISDDEILDRFNRFYWKIQLRSVAVRTLDEAKEIRSAIENGAPMDSIAEAISLDTRRFRGGLDRLKHWIDVIEDFRPAVGNLSIGQLSEPTKYREAYMILRVENRVASDTAELEYVSNIIKRDITKEKRFFAWKKFSDSLASIYPVTIDSVVLADISADAAVLFDAAFLRDNDRTAITVAGDPAATEADLRNAISHEAMNAANLPFDSILQIGVNETRENVLFDYAAEHDGYDDNSRVSEFCDNLHDSTLVQTYLQETILPEIVFSHAEFDQYFKDHMEDFRLPDQVRLENLLIKNEDTARAVRRSLTEGADFDFVARKYRLEKDDEVNQTKWYGINSFPPAVSAAIDTTPVGGTTEVFPVSDGWVIFRVAERKKGDIKPQKDVDMDIRKVMFQKKFNESMDRLLALMKDNSEIVYFEDRIADYLGQTSDK